MFAWKRTRIEAAAPFPRVLVVRVAIANSDRTDVHVAVVDVPTVGPFGVTAAGKLGHATLKRGTWHMATPERDSAPVVRLFGLAGAM
jgi:hypothetical protein